MTQPNPPTALRGYMDDQLGLEGYGMLVDWVLENVPELRHPESVRTYSKMRHDPMIAAILEAYSGPIERAKWAIDGDGCRDEVVQLVADDLGLPILGNNDDPADQADPTNAATTRRPGAGARRRNFVWSEHLRLAGLDRVFGHMWFEQAYAETGGRWRLNQVQERMPQTVSSLKLNTDGTLAGIAQEGITSGIVSVTSANAKLLKTANHQLIYYTRKREGSNYFGNSLIRPCYAPWLIKDQVQKVHATSIRRFGMGIPEVTAPDNMPASIEQAQRLAAGIAAGARMGAGMPPGYVSSWKGMTGSVPDAVAFLAYLNQEMARATITMLLVMVAAERGNRSLGETIMDLMVLAQTSDAEFHAATATSQIVVPLVDANWGEDEPAPCVHVTDVGADVQTTAQDINWLLQYGGLRPDAPVRAWIRQLRGIPAEDPDDPTNILLDNQTADTPPTTPGTMPA